MKRKLIIIITLIVIIITGIMLYFYFKKENATIEEYQPEEEISNEQMRQTIVSLYYKNKETGELMPEGRIIDSKELLGNPYKKLVELLIEQPKNDKLESAIPNETKVNKAELKNDIVYLDLSKEFIEKHINGEKEETVTIYSIVNTLTELTEVNGVKILIDGEEDKAFKENKIKFTEAFVKIDK